VAKREIVQTIAKELGLTQRQAEQIIQKTFDSIINILVEDGRVELGNFGVFQMAWPGALRWLGSWSSSGGYERKVPNHA
jgi:hypothetical protein